MSVITIDVTGLPARAEGTLVVLVDDKLAMSEAARAFIGATVLAALERAAKIEKFKAKAGGTLVLLAPAGGDLDRLIAIGVGPRADHAKLNLVDLGGSIAGAVGRAGAATVVAELPWASDSAAEDVADLSLGARLRHYSFDTYKTKKKDDEPPPALKITLAVSDPTPARKAVRLREGLATGVTMARDLVNEPPNVLFPEEFAKRAQKLAEVGVEVDVLGDKELRRLGFRALLGVGQGSARESKVVIMRWNGARSAKAKPVAFIGKGVCFDTGGISIKPAAGMEDMKGDMAGAATVVGLMHALAARKAKVNAIGAIGLVENMPDGNAQRPGDIVTSMSGQTIEIINTDAEGRLVLADVLWHVKEQFKPRFMVNLATLTGAIIVALGHEHAGMFCNDDGLAGQLTAAGIATGDKVWRMPLGPEYDKQIDSKFADMKNTGGRSGGSITAAQFLKRFVGDTPWAHLDIAGTAMGSPSSETNKGWTSGFGVRLLDRLVRDGYEG